MTYLGNSPCCYANTLAMTFGVPISPSLIEVLTSSAFGYQRIGPLPLLDPPGWDPDQGLDQALRIMGVRHERLTFEDAGDAVAALRRLVVDGPVFVGPLEMGLLRHQDGADWPIGADHFVAVLSVDAERVVMHDPQAYPFAALPIADFMAAWGSDTISYSQGRFPLRTAFTAPSGTPEAWVFASLPDALAWAEGTKAIPGFPPGNEAGLLELAEQARTSAISETTAEVLRSFTLRLGARRKSDAADALRHHPELASLLRQQAVIVGGSQLDVINSDWRALSVRLTELAELHAEVVAALRVAAG